MASVAADLNPHFAYTVVYVKDVGKSAEFYSKAFGFNVHGKSAEFYSKAFGFNVHRLDHSRRYEKC